MLDFMHARQEAFRGSYPGVYLARVQEQLSKGRIKVSVPAIYDQDQPDSQVTARPCFPYGHFFVPEKGDQVWVAFEHGDPSAPVWLGVWYPDDALPAEADVSPPAKRVIKSKSGHLIILDDTDGSESVVVKDKKGNSIEMKDSGVLIKCLADLTIDASGKKVEIKAQEVNVTQA
jgi:hypothetical protein